MSDAKDLAGLPVTVMGLGLFGGGAGVARWLCQRGARVVVTDLRDEVVLRPAVERLADLELELVLGRHRSEDFTHGGWVIANPAVAPTDDLLERARRSGCRVTSEIGLFLEHVRSRVVAITGTQGKSSTTSFTAQLLTAAGYEVRAGGNLGGSLLSELEHLRAEHVVVLELSSYQLEALPAAGGDGAPLAGVEAVALLNILSDHLERHGTREAYARAKLRILELLRAGGTAIVPSAAEGAHCRRPRRLWRLDAGSREAGLALVDGRFRCEGDDLGGVADLRLPGAFQARNVLVALGLARAIGASPTLLAQALPNLRALPHRLEDLGERAGRRILDNGVSTTPDSTLAVLGELEQGTTLLLGGKDKLGLEFDELARLAHERGTRVVAFGAAGERIARAMRAASVPVELRTDLAGAVAAAFDCTPASGTILFSPAAASFDAYPNFEHRAAHFRALVDARAGCASLP